MDNPLVKDVVNELNKHGINSAKLIYESYSPQNFGNAEVIYRVGNLLLRFLRDRDDDTVSIGGKTSPKNFYGFDDVALWMGWITLNDLLKYDQAINFDDPPPGPIFSISEAVQLIAKDIKKLDMSFAQDKLILTNAQLLDTERKRISST